MPDSAVDNLVEDQQAVYKLPEKVAQVENLAQPGAVKETSQLPHWLDEEHRAHMRLASPKGCIDIRVLSEAKKLVIKQDNLSHLTFKPTPEQLRRIVAGYLSQIAEP